MHAAANSATAVGAVPAPSGLSVKPPTATRTKTMQDTKDALAKSYNKLPPRKGDSVPAGAAGGNGGQGSGGGGPSPPGGSEPAAAYKPTAKKRSASVPPKKKGQVGKSPGDDGDPPDDDDEDPDDDECDWYEEGEEEEAVVDSENDDNDDAAPLPAAAVVPEAAAAADALDSKALTVIANVNPNKEAEKADFPALPGVAGWRRWTMDSVALVVAAAGRSDDEAMKWFRTAFALEQDVPVIGLLDYSKTFRDPLPQDLFRPTEIV